MGVEDPILILNDGDPQHPKWRFLRVPYDMFVAILDLGNKLRERGTWGTFKFREDISPDITVTYNSRDPLVNVADLENPIDFSPS